jgi:hypothetical protein
VHVCLRKSELFGVGSEDDSKLNGSQEKSDDDDEDKKREKAEAEAKAASFFKPGPCQQPQCSLENTTCARE